MENNVMHINQDKLIILLREIAAEYQHLAVLCHHHNPRYINTILAEIEEITAAYHLQKVRKTLTRNINAHTTRENEEKGNHQ